MDTSTVPPPSFSDLLTDATSSALKLELRDEYLTSDPAYLAWRAGDHAETYRQYAVWTEQARAAIERGIDMRRVRIVSEPASDYIRFEHAVTAAVNVAAGERIRWLPRHRAADLMVPACDLWLIDDVALVYLFSAAGDSAGARLIEDQVVVARFRDAVEAAWDRATDHAEYDPA